MKLWPFKKKKEEEAAEELPLPPPPEEPVAGAADIPSDIPPIRGGAPSAPEEHEIEEAEELETPAAPVPVDGAEPMPIQHPLEFEVPPTPEQLAEQPLALPEPETAEADEEAPEPFAQAAVEHAPEISTPEVELPAPSGPLFIPSQEYEKVLDDSNLIRAKLLESQHIVKSIQELRNAEDKELESWRKAIDSVERKLSYVDEVLAKSKQS